MIDKKLSVLNYFISIFMFTRSKGKVPDNESSSLMHPKKNTESQRISMKQKYKKRFKQFSQK